MPSPTEQIIPIDLSYPVLGANGPEEVNETRYLYFTMGAVSEMYKRMGIDESTAQETAQKVEDLGEEEAAKEMQKRMQGESDVSGSEITFYMIWAALQWDANQRDEEITVEDVKNMLTKENVRDVILDAMRAFIAFATGEVVSKEKMREKANIFEDEDDEVKKETGEKEPSPQS